MMTMSNEKTQKIDISALKLTAGWPKVGYDGSNDKVLQFYLRESGATKNRNSLFASKKLADIFIFAMALGKEAGLKKSYEKKKDRRETIDFEYIAGDPIYLWMMIAIAIEESDGDLAIFANPREGIIDVCEEYANYGIDLLIEMDTGGTTSDPFSAYHEKFNDLLGK